MTYIDNTTNSQEEEKSPYPVVFGITVTPVVSGIACGLLGLAAAGYILMSLVAPVQEANKKLETDLTTKEQQLQQLKSGETQKLIANLEQEVQNVQQLKPQVLALFSEQKTLDTLLLDLNKIVGNNKGTILRFQPEANDPVIIEDGSLGTLVNGKLKRKKINLEIEGTFEQTQAIIRDIERLQPLLLIKQFNSKVSESIVYVTDQNTNQPKITGIPPTLRTSFTLEAILPLSEEELAAIRKQQEEAQKAQQAAPQ